MGRIMAGILGCPFQTTNSISPLKALNETKSKKAINKRNDFIADISAFEDKLKSFSGIYEGQLPRFIG
jgi:hypothetical protein